MVLEEIEQALGAFGMPVFYGRQHIGQAEPWNYIVFARDEYVRSESRHGKTKGFTVAVVHEDYVDDDMDDRIAEALAAIPSVRPSGDPIEFDYTSKPGTGITVEVMVMRFVKAEKR